MNALCLVAVRHTLDTDVSAWVLQSRRTAYTLSCFFYRECHTKSFLAQNLPYILSVMESQKPSQMRGSTWTSLTRAKQKWYRRRPLPNRNLQLTWFSSLPGDRCFPSHLIYNVMRRRYSAQPQPGSTTNWKKEDTMLLVHKLYDVPIFYMGKETSVIQHACIACVNRDAFS